ncbi:hypothetical protein G9A89_010165 [Geosiphon pyriformis]|nr:hypothetical protein G9A89_010165 [Geosiphon pyriformis]
MLKSSGNIAKSKGHHVELELTDMFPLPFDPNPLIPWAVKPNSSQVVTGVNWSILTRDKKIA